MLRFDRLLVPTDLSEGSRPALDLACDLAARGGGEVHLLHVFSFVGPEDLGTAADVAATEALRRRLERQGEDRLSAFAASAPAGAAVEPVQISSPVPAPTIADYAEEWGADLIVMGSRGRRGLQHLLLGSIAEEVLKRAGCPVLTLRQGAPARPFRRLLVPVDLSPRSLPLLREADALARHFGASLDVLHAIEGRALPSAILGLATLADLVPELERRAQDRLDDLVREVGLAAPAEVHVARGHPAQEIAEFAERRGSDLVVIARQGTTVAGRFFVGHVTERVVRMARCPVLTLRAEPDSPRAEPGG